MQGSTVTIHWNFNTAHLTNKHIFPWVRIGVKDPEGTITMLFEDYVLGLPDPHKNNESLPGSNLKYLNKNLPLLIISDYLSGQHKREKLVEILQNIQSGRHYYFTFHVPEDAPLGKYTLISEVHSGGEVRYSKTKPDDFFLIERVTFEKLESRNNTYYASIKNHSPEKTPVKIVSCFLEGTDEIYTTVEVFELQAFEEKSVTLPTSINYLIYNEERKIVPLQKGSDYLLRNQDILEINKNNGETYLLKKDSENAYHLSETIKSLWLRSNGLLNKNQLTEEELLLFEELTAEGLVDAIQFKK
ncbi:MAG: hypothetical protein CMO01_05935 [Thalassobius sp.]|nr:hypothetical protein [Thalassovita sp.]